MIFFKDEGTVKELRIDRIRNEKIYIAIKFLA